MRRRTKIWNGSIAAPAIQSLRQISLGKDGVIRVAPTLSFGIPFAIAALGIAFGIVLNVLATGPAFAQNDKETDPFAGVEEMIVVGGGTAALLAPQSTSAVAFDAGELDSYQVEDLSDIAAYVPNLEIRSQDQTNASFFIRGVGLQDFGANATGSVPIYQDGIARNASATQLVGLYDTGGLTVLKGPQGSGSFRNASAGAIVIQSARPEMDQVSGFARVSIQKLRSAKARDAHRYDFEAASNTPVIADVLAVRLSARYKHENPFVENGCQNRTSREDRPATTTRNDPEAQLCDNETTFDPQGRPVGNGELLQGPSPIRGPVFSETKPFLSKYIGEVDDWGFRGQIRFQPPDTPHDFTLRVEISNLNRDSTVGVHLGTGGSNGDEIGVRDNFQYRDIDIERRERDLIASGLNQTQALSVIRRELRNDPLDKGPYRGDYDSPGRTLLETHTVSFEGNMEFDPVAVKTHLGFIDYRKSQQADTDLSPNPKFPSQGDNQAWELFGDLSVSGEEIGDMVIQWDTGVYSLYQKVEARQNQRIQNSRRSSTFTEEIYSFGAWADFRYEFLESFTLAGGARYNWERKDFEVQDLNTLVNPITGTATQFPPTASANQLTWDDFTGFAEIRFDFTEEISTYLKYSRGFKAGHFNASVPDQAEVAGRGYADPERLDSFEWGLNTSAWAERIQFDAAFFYYNYKDYQVFRLAARTNGVFREIQNAEKARNYGIEADLTLTPLEGYVPEEIEGLRINLRFGWLETEFLDYTEIDERVFGAFPATVQIDYSGNQLLNAPNLQVSGTFTWPVIVPRVGTLIPQYDFTWTDDTPFDANNGRGQIDGFGRSKFSPYFVGNVAYILHNVRLTYRPPGDTGLQVAGWCRNVTDERYKTFSVDISNFAKQQIHYVSDPRTCGIDFRYSW